MSLHVDVNSFAELRNPQDEYAFRRWSFAEDAHAARNALFLSVSIILLFSFSDLARYGWGDSFLNLISMRLGVVLGGIAAFALINHFHSPRSLNAGIIFFQLLAIALHSTIIAGYYSNAQTAAINEFLVILAIYLLFPNQYRHRLLVALIATFSYLTITQLYLNPGTIDFICIIVAFALTNLFGFIYSQHLEKLRRINYLELMEERQLRHSLEQEVHYRKQLEAELRHCATTDPLTGIYDRRHFMELGKKEAERAFRYQRPLSVMLIDIDHFKQVNDSLGHAAGDQVLKRLSTIIRNTLRCNDIFGRLGGDEFAVITPELEKGAAVHLAERLRRSLEGPGTDSELRITVSIGVTCVMPDDEDIAATLHRADRAMYQSKDLGRNRVISI